MEYHTQRPNEIRKRALFGIRPAYTLFLKTGTACNAGCISCPAGRKLPEDRESGGNMTPEMLDRILYRIESQGRVISATLHYYNEPTLNPHIADLVRVCHGHGIHCLMSTNGSSWVKLLPVLEQGLTNLIFSVSGWTNEVHQRSHKGIDIEVVKETMRNTSDFIKANGDFQDHRIFVRVSWHDYFYNRHERDSMALFATMMGFKFTSYNTGLLPLERAQARMLQAIADPSSPEDIGERDLRTKLAVAAVLCEQRKHWQCINQQRMLTVDGEGYLHSCCVKAHDANRWGSIFETDLELFTFHRANHDLDCRTCKAHGHHVYAMQQYRLPIGWRTEAWKRAENIWRKLNLGGLFPGISAKISQWTYDRPNR